MILHLRILATAVWHTSLSTRLVIFISFFLYVDEQVIMKSSNLIKYLERKVKVDEREQLDQGGGK